MSNEILKTFRLTLSYLFTTNPFTPLYDTSVFTLKLTISINILFFSRNVNKFDQINKKKCMSACMDLIYLETIGTLKINWHHILHTFYSLRLWQCSLFHVLILKGFFRVAHTFSFGIRKSYNFFVYICIGFHNWLQKKKLKKMIQANRSMACYY